MASGLNVGASHGLRLAFLSPRIYPLVSDENLGRTAGGAENQQLILMKLLAQRGHQVSVHCYGPEPSRTSSLHPGVEIQTMVQGGRRGFPGLRFLYPTIYEATISLIKSKPNLIYQRAAGLATGSAALAASVLKVPFVYGLASNAEVDTDLKKALPEFRTRSVFKLALPRASAVVVQNLDQLQSLPKKLVKRTHLIPNLVNPLYERPIDVNMIGRAGDVLWVGSLQSLKRVDLWLELVRRFPKLCFKMICPSTGDKYRQAPLEKLMQGARHLSNLQVIDFARSEDMPAHFFASSMLVNTSDYEGFPNTFIEAWATALPVLSFVNPRLTENGGPQLVVQNFDDLCDSVLLVSQNQQLRLELAERSLAAVRTYHASEKLIGAYEALFSELTKKS